MFGASYVIFWMFYIFPLQSCKLNIKDKYRAEKSQIKMKVKADTGNQKRKEPFFRHFKRVKAFVNDLKYL